MNNEFKKDLNLTLRGQSNKIVVYPVFSDSAKFVSLLTIAPHYFIDRKGECYSIFDKKYRICPYPSIYSAHLDSIFVAFSSLGNNLGKEEFHYLDPKLLSGGVITSEQIFSFSIFSDLFSIKGDDVICHPEIEGTDYDFTEILKKGFNGR